MSRELVEVEKIRAVLSINEPYELRMSNSAEQWLDLGVVSKHIRVVDFSGTLLQDDLASGVEFIDQQVKQKNRIYVHCKAGRSRSATMVACYLMKSLNVSPEEAVDLVRKRRPIIAINQRKLDSMKEYQLTQSQETVDRT